VKRAWTSPSDGSMSSLVTTVCCRMLFALRSGSLAFPW
jgi:hypothetical protein